MSARRCRTLDAETEQRDKQQRNTFYNRIIHNQEKCTPGGQPRRHPVSALAGASNCQPTQPRTPKDNDEYLIADFIAAFTLVNAEV